MKKFMTAVTAVSLSAMMLAGCGKADVQQESTVQESTAAETEAATETESETKVYPDEAYLDGINLGDFVELGDYKGVDVTVTKAEVTDEMVDQYIQSVLDSNKNKEEVDRAVKDGDVVDIKYVGKKDGVEFDNGSSDSYELTIGYNTFIDGFEDGVIGMKKDETKDLNLTFPEDYSNTDLAGADVVFTVTVNHVYEETDAVLDDAFVAARNIDGVSTVAEYRQYVYDNLMSSAKSQQETELERNVLEAVTANATFKETPEEMVSRYYDRLVKNLTATASMYGIDLETFMSYSYGLAADEYEDELQKSAQSAAEQIMVMQAIAEKEGLTLTDEELQADLESSASEYGYDSVDAYQEAIGDLRGYKEYLMSEKVTKYLIENANVTETEASTEEATEETTETETETTTETATEAE